jgi:DNA-binding PucR family transcriptional regulator
VARELRGLDGADRRTERLRRTLVGYFGCGQNAAAAAAALGVHQQTVGHRLRTIEERLGAPVHERRAELEVALRLREYLGDQ